jgi:fructosamine-3-kinase
VKSVGSGGVRDRVSAAVRKQIASLRMIGGGAAGTVWRVEFDDGSILVAKEAAAGLQEEARGLHLLGEMGGLPVPQVMHAEATLLIMSEAAGRSTFTKDAERHAADVLSCLHMVRSSDGMYGLDFDNYIGPLTQPNAPCSSWPEFLASRRLIPFADAAAREGRISTRARVAIERLCTRLGELVPERPRPALIHGDVWSGNVLASDERITAFLDPAPYFAHAEVELAFIRLFSTFGIEFEQAYRERMRVDASDWRAFEQVRCPLYNLYPLLVHARLFGGHYAHAIQETLRRLGFSR